MGLSLLIKLHCSRTATKLKLSHLINLQSFIPQETGQPALQTFQRTGSEMHDRCLGKHAA